MNRNSGCGPVHLLKSKKRQGSPEGVGKDGQRTPDRWIVRGAIGSPRHRRQYTAAGESRKDREAGRRGRLVAATAAEALASAGWSVRIATRFTSVAAYVEVARIGDALAQRTLLDAAAEGARAGAARPTPDPPGRAGSHQRGLGEQLLFGGADQP